MNKISTSLIIALATTTLCLGQQQELKPLHLSKVNFQTIFGTASTEPSNVYCLLGTGFFQAPGSKNSTNIITEWIKGHPNATVVPVSSFGPVEVKSPESKMVYCWVIDKQDTLNNYLIRNGCFPGSTMMRPKTWDEMEDWEKKLNKEAGEKPSVKIHVNKNSYNNFIAQIKAAELYAYQNKLGIWATETED